jgi:uncharacterized protein YbjT (DUF2867 family)
MFVVFGATGNTGSVAASTLLAQGKSVRVLVHSTAKAEAWKAKGAEATVADLEDRVALERALKGAEGAYVLLPPIFSSSHLRADNNRRAKNVSAAMTAAGVGHGSGARIVQLAGPREYTPNDVASSLGRLLGKPVAVQQHPDEAMAAAMLTAGMNDEWSRLFQELTHGLNTGRVAWEAGHSIWRGETAIEAVFVSLLGSAR